MLYLLYRGNHAELEYRGGQEPIVHLEADLHEVIQWANAAQVRWAFSLSNAGASYTQFRCQMGQLGEIDWNAVASQDFRQAEIKEGKQAEFLVYNAFPWNLVRRIGVRSRQVAMQVSEVLREAAHRPGVEIKPDWYY